MTDPARAPTAARQVVVKIGGEIVGGSGVHAVAAD